MVWKFWNISYANIRKHVFMVKVCLKVLKIVPSRSLRIRNTSPGLSIASRSARSRSRAWKHEETSKRQTRSNTHRTRNVNEHGIILRTDNHPRSHSCESTQLWSKAAYYMCTTCVRHAWANLPKMSSISSRRFFFSSSTWVLYNSSGNMIGRE
jgi:hypothetical protein